MPESTYDPALHEPVDIVRAIMAAAEAGQSFTLHGVRFDPAMAAGSGRYEGRWEVCTASEFLHAAHLGIPTRECRAGVPLELESQHWYEVLRSGDG